MLYTEDFSMRHYVGFLQIGSHIILCKDYISSLSCIIFYDCHLRTNEFDRDCMENFLFVVQYLNYHKQLQSTIIVSQLLYGD